MFYTLPTYILPKKYIRVTLKSGDKVEAVNTIHFRATGIFFQLRGGEFITIPYARVDQLDAWRKAE